MEIRSYLLPAVLASLLHVLVLGALLSHWVGRTEEAQRTPRHIQARMIDLDALATTAAAPSPEPADREQNLAEERAARAARQRQAEEAQAAQRRAEEVARQQAQEQARRQAEVQAAKRKAEQEAKRKAEQAARLKAEQEAKRRAQALAREKAAQAERQARELREAQEKARKAAQAKAEAEARAREKAAAEARAKAEAARQAAAQQAQAVIGDIQGYIQALVQRNWRIPATARNGMEAVVSIRLLGNGEIDQASILRSSGDQAFDRSALQAVYRTERFERVAQVDPLLFERRLRTIQLVFRPEGLRW